MKANTWTETNWVEYYASKAKARKASKGRAGLKPQAVASEPTKPAGGMAAFLLDPSLLPKKPPGGRA